MLSFRPLRPFVLLTALALWSSLPMEARAEVQGGIEIGAKGIRAIVVDVGKGEPKILMVENKNTTLVLDLAATRQFSAKALEETADIVAAFAKRIRDEFKVSEKHIYVVGSSGLFTPLAGDMEAIKANKERLVAAIHKTSTIKMDFVSIVREAELTITSVVPPSQRYDAVLMDIGSGNTKGGADFQGKGLITFGIPFGTVSFADRVKKQTTGDNFVAMAGKLRKELVLPALDDALKGKAELAKRKRVYLAGGTVWALATFMKPADRGNFVPLTPNDFKAFHQFLLAHPDKLPNTDVSGIADADIKKLAEKDMDQVRKTFTRDQLVAGLEILHALAEGFDLAGADKQLQFARNAYIGWILGYTIEKGNASK